MHFEVLVEDRSGCAMLDILLEKILGPNYRTHSWRTHAYKGVGRIPKNLHGTADPARRQLLTQLPRLLQGYGKSLQGESAVVVVVDADDRDCIGFKRELLEVWHAIETRPVCLFRIAVEETEAWLLGDMRAVKAAYPRARESVLGGYRQDSVCGTWEVLADAVHASGSAGLKKLGWVRAGAAKHEWATRIGQYMDIEENASGSFRIFRDGPRRLATVASPSAGQKVRPKR